MAGSFNRGAFQVDAFDVEDLVSLYASPVIAGPGQTVSATVGIAGNSAAVVVVPSHAATAEIEVVAQANSALGFTSTASAAAIVSASAAQSLSLVVQFGDLDNPIAASANQAIPAPAQTAVGEVIGLTLGSASQTISAPSQSALVNVRVSTTQTAGAFSASAFELGAFYLGAGATGIPAPTQSATASTLPGVLASQAIAVPGQAATATVLLAAASAVDVSIPTQVAEGLVLPGYLAKADIDVPTQSAIAAVHVEATSTTDLSLEEVETAEVEIAATSNVTIAAPVNAAVVVLFKLRQNFIARAPERPLFVVQVKRPMFHVKDARRPFEARLPI